MKKIFAVIALFAFASSAHARDTISIVGSSTVFPYATIGAERFSEEGYNGATIEPTGTGGGMKLFCGGLGTNFPDITNASRPMKAKEAKLCLDNGVTDVIEVVLGNDGLTFSNSVEADRFSLKKEHIFLAMAAEVPVNGEIVTNPYSTWNEIDSSYPEYKIEVLVAPPTSEQEMHLMALLWKRGVRDQVTLKLKATMKVVLLIEMTVEQSRWVKTIL